MVTTMKLFQETCLIVIIFFASHNCTRLRVPIGVIVEHEGSADLTVMKYGLWLQDRRSDWPRQYVVDIVRETAARDNLTQLDRAVCGLLKRGVYAIIAPTTLTSYQILASYSADYEIPLISPALPEIPREYSSKFIIGIQPSTTRAILDLIRNYRWEHLVYLYDDTQGPERLQQIFHLGYSAVDLSILGVHKASSAEQVNQYFRRLEQGQKHRTLHVILDMDPDLAKDIIVRHVHDIFVGKDNFHFLITKPVLEEFWSSHAMEFGAMNVTGFLALPPNTEGAFQEEWMKLSPKTWAGAGVRLNATSYFYHDAVYLLGEALRNVFRGVPYRIPADQDLYSDHSRVRDCLQSPSLPLPLGPNITYYLKKGLRKETLTGTMEFDILGNRKNIQIPIVEISASRQRLVGFWSDAHGLHMSSSNYTTEVPVPLARKGTNRYVITSIISPPFLMMRKNWNESAYKGNDKYEGFLKDFIDLLAQELDFEYELKLSSDGNYGWFQKSQGTWNGMIGEVIRGTADLAVADIYISGDRLRVVDFLDTYMTSGLSILMKSPQSVASDTSLFFVGAFSASVWLCILASALVVVVLFHITSRSIGAPDSIEAASSVWNKTFTIQQSVWFIFGSGCFQGTGIYPRSISCRVLAAAWWSFILMLTTLFIASITTQLSQYNDVDGSSAKLRSLNSLSLETILTEALKNQWPNIGIVKNRSLHRYVRESTLPFLKDYQVYLDQHPDLFVSNVSEGIARVKKSRGEYGLLLQSSSGDYFSSGSSCDIVSVRDVIDVFHHSIALPLGSPLRSALNVAQEKLKKRGELNYLEQIWFHSRGTCKTEGANKKNSPKGLYSFSGLIYFLLVALLLVAIVGVLQYFWRVRKKNRTRTNISFEEVTMPHNLPLPPPELLRDASLDEDSTPIDGWAERKLLPTSFSRAQNEEERT